MSNVPPSPRRLKIAIAVHGRFYAFDLARALLQRNHRVMLFTNYPTWAVRQFGIPAAAVRSFWPHGVASRLARSLYEAAGTPYPETVLHPLFGRWAAAQLAKEHWDLIYGWSGVSEEILSAMRGNGILRLLQRGSAHIRTQARLLEEEEQRTGARLDRPSSWAILREEREYALADRIVVLSTFAHASFTAQGVPPDKLSLLPLGARLETFRPGPAIVEARCERIASGAPLRVLYVGALSFRKGLWDLAAILRRFTGAEFQFRCVGPQMAEAARLLVDLSPLAEFVPKQPQRDLGQWYAWGDIFIFPTIEDGYAEVLAQAQAGGLPILTTANCSGPDLIRDGETGWVLPIRDPQAFVERLRWCSTNREAVAAMVRRIYSDFQPRDWDDVAADFEALSLAALADRARESLPEPFGERQA